MTVRGQQSLDPSWSLSFDALDAPLKAWHEDEINGKAKTHPPVV